MLTERERALVEATYNYCEAHPLGVVDINELFAEIEDVVGNIEQETHSSALNTLTNGK